MIEITCTCKTCKINAAKLGKTVLGARVPEALIERMGGLGRGGRHGLVHLANDPDALTGAACRARTGVTAL